MDIRLRFPFKNTYKVTQYFGENPDMYSQYGIRGHNGVDFATPIGVDIYPAIDGVVELSERYDDKKSDYGNHIVINHENYGLKTLYAHLDSINVVVGDYVTDKSIIGKSGNTGRSTGPHLHFGLKTKNVDNGYNGYIDPMPYFVIQTNPAYVTVVADGVRLRANPTEDVNDITNVIGMVYNGMEFEKAGAQTITKNGIVWQPIKVYIAMSDKEGNVLAQ
ncbi:MAG: M23 family metallopeptidase [Fervidobacterium sp.]|uniref:M23 family metallopeptidase n=1 Tax=Fervidobacterium sp. TaxID=1871331 RepID=UPI0025C3F3AA|nr:M23 family metallopeptidase [Fervidobacterium sp.]NPU89968.1 M23 family metallopeptidase [Fervidobacterium sp.]